MVEVRFGRGREVRADWSGLGGALGMGWDRMGDGWVPVAKLGGNELARHWAISANISPTAAGESLSLHHRTGETALRHD